MSEEQVFKAEEARKLKLQLSTNPATLLIGAGILLLIANMVGIQLIEYLWPGFVIGPALLLLWPAYKSTPEKEHKLSFLAVPGAILLTTGVLLFLMNLTNYFEAWAYSWVLLIAAIPAGIMYMKRFDPEHSIHVNGHKFMRTVLIIFGMMAVFFEILIFEHHSIWLAFSLMGYGVYLLAKERRTEKE